MPDGPVAVQEMEWQRRVTPKEGANVGERKKAKKDEALEVAQRWRGGFHSSEITGSLFDIFYDVRGRYAGAESFELRTRNS